MSLVLASAFLAAIAIFTPGLPLVSQQPAAPTFTRDVAPIFQEKCQSCHRPGYIAPMSLLTYEESRPWAKAIKERAITRQMPPWHIDKTTGIQKFANDRSLTDAQLSTIVRWVDGGVQKGDPKDMPAPRQWPDDSVWNFAELFGGPPDLIIKSPTYTVPAVAQDAWYRPSVDTGLTEPRWVRAIEIHPSTVKGRKITHHALATLQQQENGAGAGAGAATTSDLAAGLGGFGTGGLFMEWAVGKQGEIMRPNSGKLMLPGSKISFEVHYHAIGEEITDQVELGIYFYPKGQEPKYRQVLGLFNAIGGGRTNIDIPPNSTFTTSSITTMRQAGRVENFQPHMHLRGKGMSLEAILPDGTSQLLSRVDHFDFNWMTNYIYADDVAPILPKGTQLKVSAWYDNTRANKNNPEPDQWVGFGDRTVDEMGHAWINITYLSDEDYAKEIAKRNGTAVNLNPR
jgi:hypothetical protein